MDFSYTEEMKMYKKITKDFCERYIVPTAREYDKTREFPYEVIENMGKEGFMGINVPKEYGGLGLDHLTNAVIVEELAKASATIALIHQVHRVCINHFVTFGNDEQKNRFLPGLATGEHLGGFCFTETQTASDPMDFTCFAEKKDDHYSVNGGKGWVTNSVAGTVFVIFMRIAKENTPKSFNNFIVEKAFDGFTVSERYRTVGFCASTTCDFRFKDMKVPLKNRLGEEGDGLPHIGRTIHWGQAYLGMIGVGIGEACLEQAVKYAKQRVISGKPIIKYQLIAQKLADMFIEIESARMLCHKAVWMIENGINPAFHSRAAKIASGDACMKAGIEAIEIMGSAGYSDEYPVERYFRDAKFIAVGLGAAEIQRINLGRTIERAY